MTLVHPRAPVRKEDFITQIEDVWRRFRATVDRCGELGLNRRTSYGWHLRDVVAHVAAWEAELPERLERMRHDAEYRSPMTVEIDEFNAEAIRRRRHRPVGELLEELDASHARLLDAIRAMSPSDLTSQRVVDLFASRTFSHYQEHANDFGEESFVG